MKTVSGNVISSKPISLPKAAKTLSTFVTFENGASHAISAYLQRASTAFDELVHLHKKLKADKSEHKSKHCKLDSAKELSAEARETVTRETEMYDLNEEEPSHGEHEGFGGNRKKKKKLKKKVDADHTGNLRDNEANLSDSARKPDSHLANGALDELIGNRSNGTQKNAGVAGEKKKNKNRGQNWNDEKGNLVENGMEAGVRNDGRVMAVDEAKKKGGESNEVEEKVEKISQSSQVRRRKRKREEMTVVYRIMGSWLKSESVLRKRETVSESVLRKRETVRRLKVGEKKAVWWSA